VPTDADSIFLDDLTVGQTFTSEEHQLDPEQVIAFARQFDPQPFHLDEEAAKRTFFKGLVASGWHTAAITMRLLVQDLPIAGGLIGAGGEISWPAPTRAGAVLHAECEVLEVRPSRSRPDRGIAVVRIETVDEAGAAAQLFTVSMVVPRRREG
jgi:acyl dehydratase